MPKEQIYVSEISYNKGQEVFQKISEESAFQFLSVPEDTETLSKLISENNIRGFIADVYPYPDDALYAALPEGAVISRFGVGHDSINKEAASAHGIHVCNTPGVLNTSVKEHFIWLLGAIARNVTRLDRSMRENEWAPLRGIEVKGKTLAILGFGRIAQDICKAVHYGLGMNVVGYDQYDEAQFCQFSGVETFSDFQKEVPVCRITTACKRAVPGTAVRRRRHGMLYESGPTRPNNRAGPCDPRR